MTALAALVTAQEPTVGLSVEMPADVAPWDLVVLLAEVLDLHAGEVSMEAHGLEVGDPTALATVSSEDLARMLIVSAAPDAVRLRLIVTAPDEQARAVLAGVVDELIGWATANRVTGWRWTSDGCTGWHWGGPTCGGPTCLAETSASRPVGRWRRWTASTLGWAGAAFVAFGPVAVVMAMAAHRLGLTTPTALNTVLAGWPYASDPARGVPLALAAYAAGRLLDLAAVMIDPPVDRLTALRASVAPVVLATVAALLGWGWLA